MSILYYVPIIHPIEDYGSLGPAIKNAFTRRVGEARFNQLQKEIYQYWQITEERINKAIPDVRGLIIYHDGFPVGEREKILVLFGHIYREHPESPNFRLIKKLLDKGAILEGTEDMSLVIEQIEIYQRAAQAVSLEEQQQILAVEASRSNEIMKLRDVFITRRINDTLSESKRGILFIGRDHNVLEELEKLSDKFTIIHL